MFLWLCVDEKASTLSACGGTALELSFGEAT